MLTAITHNFIWVFDQDEALDFYVGKLGFEVHTDAQMEVMRWLTVNVPGEPDRELSLLVPQPPAVDADSVDDVRDFVARGEDRLFADDFGGVDMENACHDQYYREDP